MQLDSFFILNIKKIESKKKNILLKSENLELITYREVPNKKDILGRIALDCIPNIYQIFVESKNKNVKYKF